MNPIQPLCTEFNTITAKNCNDHEKHSIYILMYQINAILKLKTLTLLTRDIIIISMIVFNIE